MTTTSCHCGAKITKKKCGRPPKHCSDICRYRFNRWPALKQALWRILTVLERFSEP